MELILFRLNERVFFYSFKAEFDELSSLNVDDETTQKLKHLLVHIDFIQFQIFVDICIQSSRTF